MCEYYTVYLSTALCVCEYCTECVSTALCVCEYYTVYVSTALCVRVLHWHAVGKWTVGTVQQWSILTVERQIGAAEQWS